MLRELHALILQLVASPVTVLVAVRGQCLGGGLEFALAGNLLGDPSTRTVDVYLPPGYDDTKDEYPLFVALAGFTGSGLKLTPGRGFAKACRNAWNAWWRAGRCARACWQRCGGTRSAMPSGTASVVRSTWRTSWNRGATSCARTAPF